MNWRLWTWKECVGVVFVAVLVAGLAITFVGIPGFLRPHVMGPETPLGPDWTCTYPGKGDPVCVKKSPTNR